MAKILLEQILYIMGKLAFTIQILGEDPKPQHGPYTLKRL